MVMNLTCLCVSDSDLNNFVCARGEQVSSGGLIVHVNNAVLAVVEGGCGCSAVRNKGTSVRAVRAPSVSWAHKASVFDSDKGWLLPTPRQWWTRGSCHTPAPQTRSPWGGWWSVWTSICRTPLGHTFYSGADGHRRTLISKSLICC